MSPTGASPPSSPYPGLRPFRENEADLFFGREEQVEEMLAKLEDRCFLAIVGTSGCGKSSLVRAGLIPALKQGFLMDSGANWRVARMRPGNAPFSRLTGALLEDSALGQERGDDDHAAAYLMATLRRGPLGLVEAVQESYLEPDTNLLVLVDQFEEIFRFREQAKDAADAAAAFVNLLLAASKPTVSVRKLGEKVRIYVVITMRSDFIGDCALFTGLPEAINDSQFLTPRLTRTQYRAAIVEPARVFGGELAPDLVNRLLNDMRGSHDQLPLLQHALMRMWTRKSPAEQVDGKRLSINDYTAVGGLSHALSRHCDEVLAELSAKHQSIAEGMFRCLCERGSDQRDTRRPTRAREIEAVTGASFEELSQVTDAFRAPGRTFLMPPIDDPLDDDSVLDISHESLIRQWEKLNDWVSAEAKSAEIYTRLEREARSWAESGKQAGALWRTPNLDMALQWVADEKPTEGWTRRYGRDFELAKEFLRSSDQQREEEEQKAEKTRQRELENARALAEAQAAKARQQKQLAEQQKSLTEEQRVIAQQQKIQAEQKAKLAKRLKIMFAVAVTAFVIALAGGLWAINAEKASRNALEESIKQTQKAEKRLARYFGNTSQANRGKAPVLSLLLAVEATSAAYITVTDEALRQALSTNVGLPLRGHSASVWSVAYSPDGKQLASGSSDNTVRLWNLDNPNAEPIVLRGHSAYVRSVAYSPDGKQLASGSFDNTVRLWNLDNPNAEPIVLRGHSAYVWSVAYSPDGKQLASGSDDNTVRLWNLDNPNAEPIVLRGHSASVWSVAYSPDGKQLASGSDDNTVRLWNLDNPNAEPIVLRGHSASVRSVAYSPDGKQLASGSDDNTVRLWNLDNPNAEPIVLRGHSAYVWSVAYSPDGNQLASGSDDNTVRLWNLDNPNAEPIVLRGHSASVWSVAYSPDGKQLASGSDDNTVRLWNLDNPNAEPIVLRGHSASVRSVAYSPDGNQLASGSFDNTVRLWNLDNPNAEPIVLRGHSAYVWSVAYSPDGKQLASGSDDNTVRLWNLDNPNAEPIVLRGHSASVWSVAYSPDGKQLASGSDDNTVRLWNLDNPNAEPIVLRGHSASVRSVAYSPDGKQLASGSDDNTVRLWNLDNPNAEPIVLRGHSASVRSVAYSPDGKQLASGSDDNTVRLWNLDNPNAEPIVLRGHSAYVWSVAYSPDGKQLASGSDDNTVRLWNLDNPNAEPIVLRGHSASVWSVAYSPDGKQLASGSDDNTVRLWNLQISALIKQACRRAGRNMTYREWYTFLGEETYNKVCDELPYDQTFIGKGRDFARKGDVMQALVFFEKTLTLDAAPDLDVEAEARKLVAPVFVGNGRRKAEELDIEGAVLQFERAVDFDPDIDLDPRTEANRLAARAWVEKGKQRARAANLDGAQEEFKQARELDPALDMAELSAEARRIAAQALIEQGNTLASSADLDGATVQFRRAKELNEEINLEELQKKARRFAAPALLDRGLEFARQGNIEATTKAYSQAQEFDGTLKINAKYWNAMCWYGSLWGHAAKVMYACEKAVSLEPVHGGYRDSQGVARALTGDFAGAIKDFKSFLSWAPGKEQQENLIPKRESWIKALAAGQNPFDAATLEALKTE